MRFASDALARCIGFMPFLYHVKTQPAWHRTSQLDIIAHFQRIWSDRGLNAQALARFHQSVQVDSRALAYPLTTYEQLEGFAHRNQLWMQAAVELTQVVVHDLLEEVEVSPDQIDLIASATCTGIAIPTIEARLMNRIQFRPETKRLPIMGLGCLAGVAGVNRVAEYLLAYPEQAALFVTCELCSLTWQPHDTSTSNLVASSLFADGAAAVLLLGDQHPLVRSLDRPLLRWVSGRSTFFPDTERVMGFDVADSGFEVVLSSEVPAMVDENIPHLTKELASDGGIAGWEVHICHPGGPKVIAALESALELEVGGLHHSRESLRRFGNMSSASVLFILRDILDSQTLVSGENALMMAMGPAFCAELAHLQVV